MFDVFYFVPNSNNAGTANYLLTYWNSDQSIPNNEQLGYLSNSFTGLKQMRRQMSASLVLCEGNPPVTDGFPSQWVGIAESVSMFHRLVIVWG